MRTVTFAMSWTEYGIQSIEIPDDIDTSDIETVKEYIKDNWDDIPLPHGNYISGSDELDEDFPIEIQN